MVRDFLFSLQGSSKLTEFLSPGLRTGLWVEVRMRARVAHTQRRDPLEILQQ